MKSQHTTRRAILAGAAAVPVATIAGAAAALGSDEQQLAAIEGEVKELRARMREVPDQDEAAFDVLVSREIALLNKAGATRATTIEGLRCKARMSGMCEYGCATRTPVADSIVNDLIAWTAIA
jgi:hypothetical protein